MKCAILVLNVLVAAGTFCQETNLFSAPGDWSRGFEAIRIGMSAAELSVLRPEAQTTKFDESCIPEEGARRIELERMERLRDFPEKGVELEVSYEIKERKLQGVRFKWGGQFEAPEELRASFIAFCEMNFGAEFSSEVVEQTLKDAGSQFAPLLCWKIGETSISASCTTNGAFEELNYGAFILTAGPDDDSSVCSEANKARLEKRIGEETVCRVFQDAQIEIAPIQIGTYRGNKVFGDLASLCSSTDAVEVSKWAIAQRALVLVEVARLGLAVTDEEVDAAHATRLELAGFDENAANRVVRTGAALKEALRQWQADPAKERAIYDEMLAPLEVNQATWEAFKKSYPTPASLEKLWVPEDSAAARDAGKDSIRDELLRHRLAERVSGANISPEGTGWEEFVKAQEAEIAAEDLPALKLTYVQQQVGAALDSWMARQVEDGKLTFSAPEYDEAIREHARSLGKSEADEE